MNRYKAFFEGFSLDNEKLVGWSCLGNKRLDLWLHCINDLSPPYRINCNQYRIDKEELGEYAFCGFEIVINDLPQRWMRLGLKFKICIDEIGEIIIRGYRQPFKLPRIVNDINKFTNLEKRFINDNEPNKVNIFRKILRSYPAYYRDWFSLTQINREPISFEPETSLLNTNEITDKAISPFNNYLKREEINDILKGKMTLPKINNCNENIIKSTNSKLNANEKALIPEEITPEFRKFIFSKVLETQKKVSVIIPTWNRKSSILRSIDSAVNQTYQPYEIIICDDGSTDGSVVMIKKLFQSALKAKQIKIVEQTHMGVSAARNKAIMESNGDWIAYLDSDNTWHCDHLMYLLFATINQENKRFDLIYSGLSLNGERVKCKNLPVHSFNYKKLKKNNYIDLNCLIHRRTLVKKHGGFDLQLKRLVDWELLLRYTNPQNLTRVKSINIITVNYWLNKQYLNNITYCEDLYKAYNYIKNKHLYKNE